MRFDKDGSLILKKINYEVKHEEENEEIIENYIRKECIFNIEYDNKGE